MTEPIDPPDCKDCTHYGVEPGEATETEGLTFFVSLPVEAECRIMPPYLPTLVVRGDEDLCGLEGKLFEARE
jgi:hypothetical protein